MEKTETKATKPTRSVNSTEEIPQVTNIYTKLLDITQEIGVVEKDAKNVKQDYAYTSEYAIKTAVKEALIKHKVLFQMDIAEVNAQDGGTTKLGAGLQRVYIKTSFRFIDAENPDSFVEGKFAGEGIDTGDKAIYKAITGAIKYCLTTNLFIPTGDDPEGSEVEHSTAPRKNVPQKPSSASTEGASNEGLGLCRKCKSGHIVERTAKTTGKKFWGCSNFPKCDYVSWTKPVIETASEENKLSPEELSAILGEEVQQ